MTNLSIENHHWHPHESKYHVFGARASEIQSESEKSKKNTHTFLLPSQCARSRSNVKEINMLLQDHILG